jgi:hypothetical protein
VALGERLTFNFRADLSAASLKVDFLLRDVLDGFDFRADLSAASLKVNPDKRAPGVDTISALISARPH